MTSHDDFGAQLIDITNPESPSNVSVFADTLNFDAPDDITIINLEGSIYTLAISFLAAGMLISDITNRSTRDHVHFE